MSSGLTAIALFGLLAVNELHAGAILGHYPLQLSAGGGIWRNPVYGLAAFVAFACTVMLAQYLTRMIIGRMASKEQEAARNSDLLHAIINAMAEGLIFMTTDGTIALCNPAAKRWQSPCGAMETAATGNGFPGPLSGTHQEPAGVSGQCRAGRRADRFRHGRPGPSDSSRSEATRSRDWTARRSGMSSSGRT